MVSGKAKLISAIAWIYFIFGILFGLLLAFFSGPILAFITNGLIGGESGFNFAVAVPIWIGTIIQCAFIWGFAEIIEQTTISARNTTALLSRYTAQNNNTPQPPMAQPQYISYYPQQPAPYTSQFPPQQQTSQISQPPRDPAKS